MAIYTNSELAEARVSNFHRIDPEDNNVQLRKNLRYFMFELQDKNPFFQFALEVDPAGQDQNYGFHASQAIVYVKGETFRRGWVGYGNFNDTGGEDKFGVWSPHITNEKYATYSFQHHMKTSKNVKIAVKAGQAFLNPVTSADVHSVYTWSVQSSIDNESSKLKRSVGDKKEELGLTQGYGKYAEAADDLTSELLTLYDAGHEFINPQITERLQLLKDAVIERDAHKPNLQAMLVWVDGNTAKTGVVDFSQDKHKLLNERSYPSPQDMPVEIVNKISILQVGNKGDYVPDTGIRFEEDIFYVQM
tara:strand:+ start:1151 stop:2062 length:912 start_codon:yes stop_codon:yes gene_type:complete